MVDDSYDYFSDKGLPLVTSDWGVKGKSQDYSLSDRPIQVIPRDRLVQRQTYSQSNRLDDPNKPIVMNNGSVDQIVIGFQEGGFGDGS